MGNVDLVVLEDFELLVGNADELVFEVERDCALLANSAGLTRVVGDVLEQRVQTVFLLVLEDRVALSGNEDEGRGTDLAPSFG